jgi:hypothetical protein
MEFQRFKEPAAREVMRVVGDRTAYALLYQQAKREVGEEIDKGLERAVEREVRNFLVGFGGDYARAEAYLQEQGMDWEEFRRHQRRLILISLQLPKPRPITYSELVDCYNKMKEEFFAVPAAMKFQLIDIEPAKLKVTEAGKDRRQSGIALANELIKRIKAGEDFGESVKGYSGVSFVRFSEPVRPVSLAEPYDVLVAEAEKMQPGEVTGPVEAERGEHIFIMELEEKRPGSFRPLGDVQRQVKEKIILDRREQAAREIDAKLARQAALVERSEFVDFCVKEIYRISNR